MFLGGLHCGRDKDWFSSYIYLTIVKTGAELDLPLLLLHVPDAFLINGQRMDGLTQGPDNNG